MECPNCKQDMKKIRWDISYDKDKKEYDRTVYNCAADDVWVTVEAPKNNSVA